MLPPPQPTNSNTNFAALSTAHQLYCCPPLCGCRSSHQLKHKLKSVALCSTPLISNSPSNSHSKVPALDMPTLLREVAQSSACRTPSTTIFADHLLTLSTVKGIFNLSHDTVMTNYSRENPNLYPHSRYQAKPANKLIKRVNEHEPAVKPLTCCLLHSPQTPTQTLLHSP